MADALHPAVRRIVDRHPGAADALELLGSTLSGADLTALLLEVMRRRAADTSPADVMAQYRDDRFVRPASSDPRALLHLAELALDEVADPFEPVLTSPVARLGTHSVVAGVDQNRVITTVRSTEVAADPTNSLALEAAHRRRALLADEPRCATVVHLTAVERVVRAQRFEGPRSLAHFSLLGLVSAGRDTGHHRFELEAMALHVHTLARVIERCRPGANLVVRLTDMGGRHGDVVDRLVAELATADRTVDEWPDRPPAAAYYPTLCCKLFVDVGGERIEAADGGLVDWTQRLVGSRKERLMISGLSIDRLAMLGA